MPDNHLVRRLARLKGLMAVPLSAVRERARLLTLAASVPTWNMALQQDLLRCLGAEGFTQFANKHGTAPDEAARLVEAVTDCGTGL